MVNKCNVNGFRTNWHGHPTGAVFKLPNNNLKDHWIRFLNRSGVDGLKTVFICEKHFEKRFLKTNENRFRLNSSLNPIPTIISDTQASNIPLSLQKPTIVPRKKPTL